MMLIRAAALVAVLMPVPVGWAADTDVENPNMRELPLQRGGPIIGGRQHQPTPSEIQERAPLHNPSASETAGAPSTESPPAKDDLYQRVLRQSQHPTPRVIAPGDK
jgi:hypothetical protein